MKIPLLTHVPHGGSPISELRLLAFMACLGGLPSVASATVVSYTLPREFRTLFERESTGDFDPPPTAYGFESKAYPIDMNGDGTPEFITDWDFQGIRLRPVQMENQAITTNFEEIGANYYILP